MKFQPKTESEIAEQNLWPAGEYNFEVVAAEKAVSGPRSKTPGTEYIRLKLQIFNADGGFRYIETILHPAMDRLVRHFCVGANLLDVYEGGSLTADECVGVAGRVKIRVKDAEGNYPAKNEVADYLVPPTKTAAPATAKPAATTSPINDDDLPF